MPFRLQVVVGRERVEPETVVVGVRVPVVREVVYRLPAVVVKSVEGPAGADVGPSETPEAEAPSDDAPPEAQPVRQLH